MWTDQEQDQRLTGSARRRGILTQLLEDSASAVASENPNRGSGSNTKGSGSGDYPSYVSSAFDSYPY